MTSLITVFFASVGITTAIQITSQHFAARASASKAAKKANHNCGCRNGLKSPCPGCFKSQLKHSHE